MKKITMIALAFCLVGGAVSAQEKKSAYTPTAEAAAAFAKKFPGAENVKWKAEGKDGEAKFMLNGIKTEAVFDNKGNWIQTETKVPVATLPAAAGEYMKKNYPNIPVDKLAKIVKANGTVLFEVESKDKDILFDTAGKFVEESKD
ncbi:PepSY-like domain-containing protein [Chitinophaga dinghuensis]|nr:PepSY-like domain-containing protein [Chitinophaga dinghuensis]